MHSEAFYTCVLHKLDCFQNPTDLFEVDMNFQMLLGALVRDLKKKFAEGLVMSLSVQLGK